jgi:hypothetical protein
MVYDYFRNIDQIRIRSTIHLLKRCLPPFLDVGCGSKEISKEVAVVAAEVCERRRPAVVASKG